MPRHHSISICYSVFVQCNSLTTIIIGHFPHSRLFTELILCFGSFQLGEAELVIEAAEYAYLLLRLLLYHFDLRELLLRVCCRS